VLATGSELAIALEGARSLDLNARVVSLPCWELFDAQPEAYRDEVLPPSVTARVSIEAGVTFGWERYVGPGGASIGVDRFGASAPYERIYEELGLTPQAVADAVGRVA
jgi:transketolase